MVEVKRTFPRLSGTLALASLMSLGLFGAGYARGVSTPYTYMMWNLFLAWLPLVFVMWLVTLLRRKRWSSWEGIGVSLLWLGFLPNSFYLVSDFIHLREAAGNTVIFNAVMFMSFALNGLLLGYTSLYLFQTELRKRLPRTSVRNVIALVLLLCSFAIYLGRDLRWNTWDVLVNPAGILFDISNRFISPWTYPRMFVITGAFFVLLTTVYYIILNIANDLRQPIRK